MIERRIKELCFAIEALSRVVTLGDEFHRLQDLLRDALREAETEVDKPISPPHTNDGIPF